MPLVRNGGRPSLFCCARHRVAYNRLRGQAENDQNLQARVATWRHEHPWEIHHSKEEHRDALEEIAQSWQEAPQLGGAGQLLKLAAKAQDLLHILDLAEGYDWALAECDCPGLDDLRDYREALESLTDLEYLDLSGLGRVVAKLRRNAEELWDFASRAMESEEPL